MDPIEGVNYSPLSVQDLQEITNTLQTVKESVQQNARSYVFIDPHTYKVGITLDKKKSATLEQIAQHINAIALEYKRSSSFLPTEEDDLKLLNLINSFQELKALIPNSADSKIFSFLRDFPDIKTIKKEIRLTTKDTLWKIGKLGTKTCNWIKDSALTIKDSPIGKMFSKVSHIAEKQRVNLATNLSSATNNLSNRSIKVFKKVSKKAKEVSLDIKVKAGKAKKTVDKQVSSLKKETRLKTASIKNTLENRIEKVKTVVQQKLNFLFSRAHVSEKTE